jgi:cytoskeletal protein RodZ
VSERFPESTRNAPIEASEATNAANAVDASSAPTSSKRGRGNTDSKRRESRGYETIGTTLKRGRLQKDMSLAEVSRVTRIPAHTLEKIEDDHFDDLPGEVFAKGFLKAYAQAVGVDAKDILARYSASRRVAVVTPLPVTSPVQAAREGQGRRFGVAIALVLLLILFTLAISIVLKPRGRDVPHELSQGDATTSLRAV